jgi:hypothetical protein
MQIKPLSLLGFFIVEPKQFGDEIVIFSETFLSGLLY